jgi:hypothetical protein
MEYVRLLKVQRRFFPKIIKELKENGRKISHWNWYVFPNTYIGNDPLKTKVENDNKYLEEFLSLADPKWIEILTLISDIIDRNGIKWSGCMPITDHNRMEQSINFWLSKPFINNFIDFKNALKRLKNQK